MGWIARSLAPALIFVPGLALLLAAPATAQFSNPESPYTTVHNPAALHPPAGSSVAIIEFEDLQCPDCAHANPVVEEAAKRFRIPLVRHDFPLPFHTWSFEAAVDARWFDTQSQKLGDDFRDAIFSAQPTIHNHQELQAFAVRFAQQHGLTFPAVVDPHGVLAGRVKDDYELGLDIGVKHTPTIWVVTNRTSGKPFVEVVDRARLFTLIEEALAETGSR